MKLSQKDYRPVLQAVGLLIMFGVACHAQTAGPEAALKSIARMLLGCFTWIGVLGLMWHCIGFLFDRGHFGDIVKWAIGTGLAFGAYYIVGLVSASSTASF